MGVLNVNYDEIKRQIDYVDSHLIICKTRKEFYDYFATYEVLCDLYKRATGIDVFDVSGPIKLTGEFVKNSIQKETISRFYADFYQNRGLSFELFKEAYLEGQKKYVDFLQQDGGYLESIKPKMLSGDIEAMKIVYSFLDSEFPDLKVIFDGLLASGRIFKVNDNSVDCAGYMFYNSVENISNLFFRNSFKAISDLSTFVHEFGHVVDVEGLSKIHPELCFPDANCLRYDVEAIPCYYQFAFLEYLIKNNIYKDDALRELDTVVGALLYHLENGFLLGFANLEEYDRIKVGHITKRDYVDGLLNRGIDLPEILVQGDLDYTISIPETASYAYGLTLGCAISDSDVYEKFVANQGIGISEFLDKTDITPNKTVHQLIKKIETLYI